MPVWEIPMNKLSVLICFSKSAWKDARKYLVLTLSVNVFNGVIPLINIVGLGSVIDAFLNDQPLSAVIPIILAYLSLNLIISVAGQTFNLFNNNEMRRLTNEIQKSYMRDTVNIDYHYVSDGQIANLRRKSMGAYPAFFLSTWGECCRFSIQIIGALAVFAALSPLFIAVSAVLSTALIILNLYIQKKEYNFNNETVDDDRRLDYTYTVMTAAEYAKEIRINSAGGFIRDKFKAALETQLRRLKALTRKRLLVGSLSVIFASLQSAVMYLYFTYAVSAGRIDIAQYTVLLGSTTLLLSALVSMFTQAGYVNSSIKSYSFLREYQEILEKNSTVAQSENLPDQAIDYAKSVIKFEDVSFCYPGASDYALKNITLEIPCNQTLGIVGLNGSGKSTLVKLILRLYAPTRGRITLNDTDISEIPFSSYIQHIGVVIQDYTLFAYSVKENMIFDRPENTGRLADSIAKSGLKQKIESLPRGIDTSVGRDLDDGGIAFSGGESQKLAVARADYRGADILILDEPTSALDPISEYHLFQMLNEMSQEKTAIFITHRLSSTRFCDHLIVLSKGEVIEQGSHSALMRQGGEYAKLFNLQAKYYSQEGAK